MFYLFKKKIEISLVDCQNYEVILKNLIGILNKQNLDFHANILQKALDKLVEKDFDNFVTLINRMDIWGSSGSVWEVYIENREDDLQFEQGIIDLINLMERTKILKRGIKNIRKFFTKNLNYNILMNI